MTSIAGRVQMVCDLLRPRGFDEEGNETDLPPLITLEEALKILEGAHDD